MTNPLRVGCGQLAATKDPVQNLAAASALIRQAGEVGVRLLVLPEATMANFSMSLGAVAQPLDGPWADGVREAADRAGLTVVVGMFEPAEDDRTYNTLLVTDGRSREVSYRKVHLYDAFGSKESQTVHPGSGYVTFDLDGVCVGLATCYDVRFAEQFTALGLGGAEVVCLAASWGDGPGKAEQWDLLTRARALDAQAWLVACGQAWQEPIGSAPLGIGRSVVIDPLGAVRARLSSAPDVLVTDIDLSMVEAVRARVPVLRSLAQGRG